jgi:hypothetical protein
MQRMNLFRTDNGYWNNVTNSIMTTLQQDEMYYIFFPANKDNKEAIDNKGIYKIWINCLFL